MIAQPIFFAILLLFQGDDQGAPVPPPHSSSNAILEMLRASGPIAMRFWDQTALPFTYSLLEHFPIGERFFCSVLAQTYPNRRFFFTGTASGITATGTICSFTRGS